MKKRFSISNSISRGMSEAISIAEQGAGNFRNTIIPLSRIELDPENPRKILLTMEDLPKGPKSSDPLYSEKLNEFEKLKDLGKTIESRGLIQPIAVYKYSENYRIVAGHRRYLASLIIGKKEIEARVFNEKPKKLELKLVQLIENTSREDLSLLEKLNNLKEIIKEFSSDTGSERITAERLHSITGVSLTAAKYYLSVLSSLDVLEAIRNGQIQNLEKAALIANIEDEVIRRKAIAACREGVNKERLKQIISEGKQKKQVIVKASTRGRVASQINMGSTKKTEIVKELIQAVLERPHFTEYKNEFSQVDWSGYKQVQQAFKQLITIIESKVVG